MRAPTKIAKLADRQLRDRHDTTLRGYLADRRERRRYFHEIAEELEELIGVDVSHETIRRWCEAYAIGEELAA